jgi:hypothetical protein
MFSDMGTAPQLMVRKEGMSTNAEVPPAWATESVHLFDADPAWALRGERNATILKRCWHPG